MLDSCLPDKDLCFSAGQVLIHTGLASVRAALLLLFLRLAGAYATANVYGPELIGSRQQEKIFTLSFFVVGLGFKVDFSIFGLAIASLRRLLTRCVFRRIRYDFTRSYSDHGDLFSCLSFDRWISANFFSCPCLFTKRDVCFAHIVHLRLAAPARAGGTSRSSALL